MFVRTKKIKKYKYAYLVENTWKKKSSRQKVSAYLGRVYEFDEGAQPTIHSLEGLSFDQSIRALITAHLKQLGFRENETGNCLEKDGLIFSQDDLSFKQKNGKSFVIKNYDGYLCDHTISELISFKKAGDEEQTGFKLARACISAGLNVPKESFVELFEKICPVRESVVVKKEAVES